MIKQMEAVRCIVGPTLTLCNAPGMVCGVSDQKSLLFASNNCAIACCPLRGQLCIPFSATRFGSLCQSSSKVRASSFSSSHSPRSAQHCATAASSSKGALDSDAESRRQILRSPLISGRKSGNTLGAKSLGKGQQRFRTQSAKSDGPADEERTLSKELDAFYESLDLEYESVWDTKPAW